MRQRQLTALNMKQLNTIGTKVANLSKKITGLSVKVAELFLVTLLLISVDALAQANLCDAHWYNSASSRDISNAIRNGANVNQSCSSGSPLLLALEHGRAEVVLALIRAGASLYHRDLYSRQTPIGVINYRCKIGLTDYGTCNEIERLEQHFEAIAEAQNNLCDPRWWESFGRLTQRTAIRHMRAMIRSTPGLDVNYDCGRGDRPLHIALKISAPLTTGATWAIGTFIYEAKNVDRFVRNRSGRSPMHLAEARYGSQMRGYRHLLSILCKNQISLREYGWRYQGYKNEESIYRYIKEYGGQAYREQEVSIRLTFFESVVCALY